MPAERDEASLLLARIAERPADALAVVAAQESPVAFLLKREGEIARWTCGDVAL